MRITSPNLSGDPHAFIDSVADRHSDSDNHHFVAGYRPRLTFRKRKPRFDCSKRGRIFERLAGYGFAVARLPAAGALVIGRETIEEMADGALAGAAAGAERNSVGFLLTASSARVWSAGLQVL